MHLQKHAGFGHTTAATDSDQEIGMQLMRRAAAAGGQDALRYLVSGSAN
jgi:hypothetical protein